MKTLVDSSVRVDFFAVRNTPQTAALARLIQEGDVAICDLILAEVLQGFRADKDFKIAKEILSDVPSFKMYSGIFVYAAELCRHAGKQGVTIRKSNDCTIAAVAIMNVVPLLHNDRDFDAIAGVSELRTLVCN